MIQTAVLEEHVYFRLGIRFTFEGNPYIRIVGEANNGADFFKLLARTGADVALVGVNNPDDRSCVDTVCRLRLNYPDLKILAVANEDTAQVVQSMMKAGINGYIGKRQADSAELEKAIRTVAAGGQYIGRIDSNLKQETIY
jgi:DNA-binding NarL/FixJ family response regulator